MKISEAKIPDGRNTRWEAHRQQRRHELIRAARAAVHTIGPSVSMEEIATHAGTSKSVFYRYFKDKQGLQQAVAQASIDFMEVELKKAASKATIPSEGLFTMVLVYLRLAGSSPSVYNFSTAIPTGMKILRENMALFLQQAVEQLAPRYRHNSQGNQLSYYWAIAAVGFVQAAGERWIAQLDNDDLPDAEHLARSISNWLLQGLDSIETSPEPRQE